MNSKVLVLFSWNDEEIILFLLFDYIQAITNIYLSCIDCLGEKLAITLRFLASGIDMTTLGAGNCVGHSTARKIVVDTATSLYELVTWVPIFTRYSRMEGNSLIIWNLSNFPNIDGAID